MRLETAQKLLVAFAYMVVGAGIVVMVLIAADNAAAYPNPPEPPDVPAPPWTTAGRLTAPHQNLPPPTGWTTEARITEVYDGDTLTVEVTRRFKVRLLDCWAPEIRTRDADEKARGLEAAAHLTQLAEGKRAVLHVPLQGIDAADAWSFGRVLGHVWVEGSEQSLSQQMVAAGHATQTKGE